MNKQEIKNSLEVKSRTQHITFENFDKYLEEERSKAKEEAIDDIRRNLNKNTSN
ncbi:MAG TPA: hypothetical protein PKD16_01380 [Saprospiraceae bacterium]|jgi:hypothetical protein|nr:hypothetical protein [Saprospiraceae bacterium]